MPTGVIQGIRQEQEYYDQDPEREKRAKEEQRDLDQQQEREAQEN